MIDIGETEDIPWTWRNKRNQLTVAQHADRPAYVMYQTEDKCVYFLVLLPFSRRKQFNLTKI